MSWTYLITLVIAQYLTILMRNGTDDARGLVLFLAPSIVALLWREWRFGDKYLRADVVGQRSRWERRAFFVFGDTAPDESAENDERREFQELVKSSYHSQSLVVYALTLAGLAGALYYWQRPLPEGAYWIAFLGLPLVIASHASHFLAALFMTLPLALESAWAGTCSWPLVGGYVATFIFGLGAHREFVTGDARGNFVWFSAIRASAVFLGLLAFFHAVMPDFRPPDFEMSVPLPQNEALRRRLMRNVAERLVDWQNQSDFAKGLRMPSAKSEAPKTPPRFDEKTRQAAREFAEEFARASRERRLPGKAAEKLQQGQSLSPEERRQVEDFMKSRPAGDPRALEDLQKALAGGAGGGDLEQRARAAESEMRDAAKNGTLPKDLPDKLASGQQLDPAEKQQLEDFLRSQAGGAGGGAGQGSGGQGAGAEGTKSAAAPTPGGPGAASAPEPGREEKSAAGSPSTASAPAGANSGSRENRAASNPASSSSASPSSSLSSKAAQAGERPGEPKPPEIAGVTHAEASPTPKPKDEQVRETQKSLESLLQKLKTWFKIAFPFLAIGFGLWLWRKFSRTPDPNDVKSVRLTKEERARLRERMVELKARKLAPDEEVIETYNALLQIFEVAHFPRPQEIPASVFAASVGRELPPIGKPMIETTSRFDRTLYGRSVPTSTELERFRVSSRLICRYFDI